MNSGHEDVPNVRLGSFTDNCYCEQLVNNSKNIVIFFSLPTIVGNSFGTEIGRKKFKTFIKI